MRWLGDFIGALWRHAQFWRISPLEGVRTGSASAGCLMFLAMIFTIIAVILVALGFDLDQVDAWIDQQGWLSLVGSVLFRVLVWLVFLFCTLCCIVMIWALFADRESLGKSIWGSVFTWLTLALIAWVCSASLFAPLY